MIDSEPTTLEVGTTDYVWAKVEDRRGRDITTVGFEMATVDPAGVQSAWVPPDDRDDDLAAAGVVRIGLLHVATDQGRGYWKLRWRATDNPTTIVDTAGSFRVI